MEVVVSENDNDVCNSWEDIDDSADILEKQLERLKLQKVKGNELEDELSPLKDGNGSSGPIRVTLDSTTEESLRTQYAPPEPKMTILARPKTTTNNNTQYSHHNKSQPKNNIKTAPQTKTLQQREQEYAAARMRILGDVRFEAEEAEAEMETALSPAEILKLKIAEAIRADGPSTVNPNNSKKLNKKQSHAKEKSPTSNPADGLSSSNESSDGGQPLNPQQNGTTTTAATVAVAGKPSNRRNKRSREKLKTVNPEPTRDFPVHKTESDRIIRHPRGPDGSSGFTAHRTS